MPTASEGRRAWGRGPRGDFGGSCPCPPVGWRTRPNGGDASSQRGRSRGRAGEGERRPGCRRREVPPGPRGCGQTPASPRAALAHPVGRPRRDLPLSREGGEHGRPPVACPAGTARLPSAPTGNQPATTWAARGRAGGRAGGHAHLSPTSAARAPDTPPR